MSSPRVAMITRELNSYRVPFFEASRALLTERGVEFEVYVGGATAADRSKKDPAVLDWAQELAVREFTIRERNVWWQPVLGLSQQVNLIITEQATKQLVNLPLALLQRRGRIRHCLWGHGRNFQRSIDGGQGEDLKQWFTRDAHWFFSYTDASTAALTGTGFPAERISTFNNSTDVAAIREQRASITEDHLQRVRQDLGIGDGPVVGYLGALYPPKRTDFLLHAVDALRAEVPNVEVVIIGGGSDALKASDFAATRPFVHALGAMYGTERVEVALLSELLLMPGLVGLNIVDGFAMGLPTVTTDIDYHSPEISYLEHGRNGWVSDVSASPQTYASDVAAILRDPARLAELQKGAEQAGDDLGIDEMATRFTNGVLAALSAPNRLPNSPHR